MESLKLIIRPTCVDLGKVLGYVPNFLGIFFSEIAIFKTIGFQNIAKILKVCLLCSLTCSQIWLIPHLEDHHCGYITKLGKKRGKKPPVLQIDMCQTPGKKILSGQSSFSHSLFLHFLSFIHSVFVPFISFILRFIHSFIVSFIYSFIFRSYHSFILCFIHSFIASFIRSFFLSFCFFPDG